MRTNNNQGKKQQTTGLLWNNDPRLPLAEQILNSDDNWLNKVETDFVTKSKNRKNFITRRNWSIAIAVMLGLSGLTIAALIGQRQALMKQISADKNSTQTLLSTNQLKLDSLLSSLRAGKSLKHWLLWGPFQPDEQLQNQVVSTLRTAFYTVREENRWQLPQDLEIKDILLSKDTKPLVATTTNKGTVCVWDFESKQCDELPSNEGLIDTVKFSPDGRKLAIANQDGILRLWDFESKRFRQLPRFKGKVKRINFRHDSKQLAIITEESYYGTAYLWDLENKRVYPLKKFLNQVIGINFSLNDSLLVATTSNNNIVQLWDYGISSGFKKLDEFKSPSIRDNDDTIINPNSKQLVITHENYVGKDQLVSLRNVGYPTDTSDFLEELGTYVNVTFNSNGEQIAITDPYGIIRLRDSSRSEELVIKGHQGLVKNTSFSPDGKQILTASNDGTVSLWNIESQKLKPFPKLPKIPGSVSKTSFSPDGKQLATLEAGIVRLWDMSSGSLETLPQQFAPKSDLIFFSPTGKQLAIVEPNAIRLWDLSLGKQSNTSFFKESVDSTGGSFSPDAKKLAINIHSKICVFNLANGKPEDCHQTPFFVRSMNWTADGKLLVASVGGDSIEIWDWNFFSWKQLASLRKDNSSYTTEGTISFNHDGNLLAIPSVNGYILWNWRNSQSTEFKENVDGISPDGSILAEIIQNNHVNLWQMGGLDELIEQGCQYVRGYLVNLDENNSDRNLCNGVASPVAQIPMSMGEKILTPNTYVQQKQAGVEAIANGNFTKAADILTAYLNQKPNPNDPEALIYLNNAAIGSLPSYTIAVSVPMSSDDKGALEMLRGVAQAQDNINNKNGGINGRKLQVLIADDKNNPELAKQIADKFSNNPNVLGVIGHYASDTTLATREIYNKGKLPAISPVSTSVKLSYSNLSNLFGRYTFRTVPSDKNAAQKLAEYMRNNYLQSKAIVFYNSQSEYSNSLTNEFVNDIRSSKVSKKIDLSDPNFDAAKSIEQVEPGTVLVLMPNVDKLDNALKVVEANTQRQRLPILAGDDVYSPTTLEKRESAEGMVVAVPWDIDLHRDKAFVKRSSQLWNRDVNWRTAMSYDATQALIAAIQAAVQHEPNPTREGVAKALRSNKLQTDNLATGEVSFSSSGDRNESNIELVQIKRTSNSRYDFVPVGANLNK